MAKYGLGRGLESLIPSFENEGAQEGEPSKKATRVHLDRRAGQEGLQEVALDLIKVNPYQPRKNFSPEELEEMKNSIKEHGILEPIVVTKVGDGYELIAGERRTQAARLAGLSTIPAVIRGKASDQQKLELALIENVQRTDLNSMEKARAFKQLAKEFGISQEQISKRIGKSRVYVTNTIHLLDLPVEIQKGIESSEISEGHGRAILMIKGEAKQKVAFEKVKAQKLSVRQTEDLARLLNTIEVGKNEKAGHEVMQDPDIVSKQEELQRLLGTKVSIVPKARGGRIVIEYFSKNDLNVLAEKLTETLEN